MIKNKIFVFGSNLAGRHGRGAAKHAKANPDKEFFVTKIGTGLAGYSNEQIAPMFKDCPANCELDSAWIKIIKKEIK